MLDKLLNNSGLAKYQSEYRPRQTLFTEGDTSADLYILISGELEVLKGRTLINQIVIPGELFGEMSFLLGTRRTATVKAREKVRAFRVPQDQIEQVLGEFPELSQAITKVLAKRLDEASHLVHGLKELSDTLPDAMIITDEHGRLLSLNRAAKDLYGRSFTDVLHKPVAELYEEPEAYWEMWEEVKRKESVQEQVVTLMHPERGRRFFSLSLTALFDGHANFQGMVSLARDVTSLHNLRRKYRTAFYWLIPPLLLIALLAGVTYYGYPYFIKGHTTTALQRHELKSVLAKDYLLLKSLMGKAITQRDLNKVDRELKKFFAVQETAASPYVGLVVLDLDKKVIATFSPRKGAGSRQALGTTYARLNFQGHERSIHRVLTLWRTDPNQPGSYRSVEVAFPLSADGQTQAWLVFQMDPQKLAKVYGLNEEDLTNFEFQEP